MSASDQFHSLKIAILTVSDTRTTATDTSGDILEASASIEGHQVIIRQIVKDDVYQIRAVIAQWIALQEVQAILITGGTGFSGRDSTPEAVSPLLDKEIVGFGEMFRHLSLEQVGSSTIQSRALGGFANKTVVFCLPGSNNACKTAWDGILKEQLDSRHSPCNFVDLLQ